MNKLLIHSNNTSFNHTSIFLTNEQFVFDVDLDKDVDQYIDEKLADGAFKKQLENSDIIFIKVSLSENYLEYFGIRLAYHIRLSKSLEKASKIPIIFIAEETFQFLGLTAPEPSILFTKGIYLIREMIEDFQKIQKWYKENKIKSLENDDSFIESININPPANYQSHHSIANEWALVRYFSMLEKDESNPAYNTLKNKIHELHYTKTLHFKFAEAKATRQKINPKKHSYTPIINKIENKTIGILDDEIDKGWLAFYDCLLNKSNAKTVPFRAFLKYETKKNLLERIQKWLLDILTSDEPVDIFIIDLRLHDDDYSESNFDALSGLSIIKFIKSHNPGIQIIVSTASNKVWNYQECLKHGVLHFAIKESPETFNSREDTKKTLIHLCNEISNASSRSFLAVIYRKVKQLQTTNIFLKDQANKEFKELVFEKNGLLDQVLNLLLLNDSNGNGIIFNQSLLLLFKIIEIYCKLPTIGDFGDNNSSGTRLSSGYVWLKSKQKKDIFINRSNQKIFTWFKLNHGKFDFQTNNSPETPTSFEAFTEMRLISAFQNGLDASFLVKMISIFYYRENISKEDIEKLIRLRYYRSNVVAHFTGRVDTKAQVNSDDILFLIEIFVKLFCN